MIGSGVAVAQPKSNFQRVEVATQCHDLLEMSMPVLVDGVDDRVGHAYSGMPDRLYIIDREGKVAFKSGRGPSGSTRRRWNGPDHDAAGGCPPVKKARLAFPALPRRGRLAIPAPMTTATPNLDRVPAEFHLP